MCLLFCNIYYNDPFNVKDYICYVIIFLPSPPRYATLLTIIICGTVPKYYRGLFLHAHPV